MQRLIISKLLFQNQTAALEDHLQLSLLSEVREHVPITGKRKIALHFFEVRVSLPVLVLLPNKNEGKNSHPTNPPSYYQNRWC